MDVCQLKVLRENTFYRNNITHFVQNLECPAKYDQPTKSILTKISILTKNFNFV